MAWINKSIEDLVNYRIQQEELSSRIYLAMSKWLTKNGYFGASKLFKKWSDEELVHAGFAYTYLEDLNIQPCVPELEKVEENFTSLKEIVQKAFEHEMVVTEQCNELTKAAMSANDFMTMTLGQKYMLEQQEEIAKTTYWNDRILAFGVDKTALLVIDNEMGED